MQTRVCRLYQAHDLRIETDNLSAPAVDEVVVDMSHGGICGSDLHYFHDGGFGNVRVKNPIILGHEVAGIVRERGSDVTEIEIGDRVAINPSRPCGKCRFCLSSHANQCLDMRFFGSAMRNPHVDGAFADQIVTSANQCVKLAQNVPLAWGATAEPLAVCLHAAAQASDLQGKKVLITGAGPIGSLCAAVAKALGAAEIAITDLEDFPLSIAAQMGATQTINIAKNADGLQKLNADKGFFDVALECSGAVPALNATIEATRPGGTIVQVGMGGQATIALQAIVAKELNLKGTFRFDQEFAQAVDWLNQGQIDPSPMLTRTYNLDDAQDAFEAASDRQNNIKVQLRFAASENT